MSISSRKKITQFNRRQAGFRVEVACSPEHLLQAQHDVPAPHTSIVYASHARRFLCIKQYTEALPVLLAVQKTDAFPVDDLIGAMLVFITAATAAAAGGGGRNLDEHADVFSHKRIRTKVI
jgi:hypothetical protein